MYPFTIGDWEKILKHLRRDLKQFQESANGFGLTLELGERPELKETYTRWKQEADDEVAELKALIKLIEDKECD